MPDVPGLMPLTMLNFGERNGLDVARLCEGLSLSRGTLRTLGKRASWDEVATLFERLDTALPNMSERFAEHYVRAFPLAGWIASYVVSLPALYRVAFFAWSRVFPWIEHTLELDGEALSSRMTFRPGSRVCLPHLRNGAEIQRRLPRLLGARDLDLEWTVEGATLICEGALPRGGAHVRDDVDAAELFGRMGQEVFGAIVPIRVPADWGLTATEQRVLEALAQGASAKDIATRLNVSYETVRTHVKRTMSKAGVHRQAELLARVLSTRASESEVL